ncbi:DUF3325 domain-containing protein [Shewanella nanhaiensis]|uniref:DUF3325 domain-containing protein n=1 Tax=Shewanella nanhaiensis TaxID=2864872 RepID=A0ABS7E9L9_9GAMM|nr:DUF3325 domain-containing protein [Shewanella nanhaiensis]MBW8186265.1 DUF3325 domain-containing protein [Shewanella nanhaiensis]
MISNSMTLSLLTFSYLALGCMALAMFSHFRDTFKRSPTPAQSRGLYWTGWGILTLSYYLGIRYLGFAYGSILFTGILSFAGLLVILTASYQPKHLPHLMAGSSSLGVALMFIG